MNIFKDIKNIAILVLIAVVVVSQIRGCKPNDDKTDTIIETKVEVKEIPVKVEVPKYVPKTVVEVQEVVVTGPVDTTAILSKYFKKYKLIDTLNIPYNAGFPDSLKFPNRPNGIGHGIVTDIVTQNQIVERSIVWDYSIPLIEKTVTKIIYPKSKTQVYYGFGSGFNKVNFIDNVYGGVIIKTKTDKIYSANLGVSSTGGGVTPFVGGGIYWKIQLKKPKVTDLIK